MSERAIVLLVGGGSVGAIAALNLEAGRQAATTVVCRSNFLAVQEHGYTIRSCDHGLVNHFKPARVVDKVPEVVPGGTMPGFDFVVCLTKNIADVSPSVSELIKPAVTPGRTVIVLVQNGLNIEKPLFAAFPHNVVLSGVSLIASNEPQPGTIDQDGPDILFVGPFRNPNLPAEKEKAAAEDFVRIYSASNKTQCSYVPNVGLTRWRKLVFNSCLNSICAITGLDTGRIRLADGAVDGLVRPAMREIVAVARASGHDLPDSVVDEMIEMDPLDLYLPPSMLSDTRKGNLIEFENIIGEPLREGERLGLPMPTLKVLYHICQSIQWKNKELKGLVQVPPKRSVAN